MICHFSFCQYWLWLYLFLLTLKCLQSADRFDLIQDAQVIFTWISSVFQVLKLTFYINLMHSKTNAEVIFGKCVVNASHLALIMKL